MMIGEVYSLIIYCLSIIGLFSNFLLIWLIIRYTMKEMQIYNRILLQTCIVDIIGIFVFAFVQPVNILIKNIRKLRTVR